MTRAPRTLQGLALHASNSRYVTFALFGACRAQNRQAGQRAPGQLPELGRPRRRGLLPGLGRGPGYWLGGGSDDLGLEGRVLERELTPLLEGRDRATGEALAARHHKARVSGFDLTFRAPKSVSLLHALGPKEASNEVVDAHDSAVLAALDYLERHASEGRRGTDGVDPIGSSGFVAAAFRHRTSRAGDPLLHTHVLVANLIHCWDDKWSALDGRLLYNQAKTAGYLYQAQLRKELTRRLGVEWTRSETVPRRSRASREKPSRSSPDAGPRSRSAWSNAAS
jgi:hypothetical protein